jgi:hypothetical protein
MLPRSARTPSRWTVTPNIFAFALAAVSGVIKIAHLTTNPVEARDRRGSVLPEKGVASASRSVKVSKTDPSKTNY